MECTQQKDFLQHQKKCTMCKHCQPPPKKRDEQGKDAQILQQQKGKATSLLSTKPRVLLVLHWESSTRPTCHTATAGPIGAVCKPSSRAQPSFSLMSTSILQIKAGFAKYRCFFPLAYMIAAWPTIKHIKITVRQEHAWMFKMNLSRTIREYCNCITTNSSTQWQPSWCRKSLSKQPETLCGNPLTVCYPDPCREAWPTCFQNTHAFLQPHP